MTGSLPNDAALRTGGSGVWTFTAARESGRKRVAPGGAKRNPGSQGKNERRARLGGRQQSQSRSGAQIFLRKSVHRERSVARSRGLQLPIFVFLNPGFRFAPPGATRFRPLSRASVNVQTPEPAAGGRSECGPGRSAAEPWECEIDQIFESPSRVAGRATERFRKSAILCRPPPREERASSSNKFSLSQGYAALRPGPHSGARKCGLVLLTTWTAPVRSH